MRFSVSSSLTYAVAAPSTLILNIHALRNPSQTILEEKFSVDPWCKVEELNTNSGENRFMRLETGTLPQIKINYTAVVEVNHHIISADHLNTVPVSKLTPSIIPYLFPSRYCQSDQLGRLAYSKFGNITNTYQQVQAITDWVNKNIEYLPGLTNASTSAYDTVIQRAGVCRDFAHLGIALCRALSIPARYFTAYAFNLQPPDFHALFEAYIGNRWMLFDATHLVPLNGVVRIGSGRDAADAAVATMFGRVRCTAMAVNCQSLTENFQPLHRQNLEKQGISLEAE